MKNLPNWVLTNPFPAFYDSESGSSIEQTAKVYKAMQDLIKEHNTFIEQLQTTIEEFNCDNEDFKVCVTQLVENYLKMIDEKIIQQDLAIEKALTGPTTEIVEDVLKTAIENETITATGTYDENSESLEIVLNYKE